MMEYSAGLPSQLFWLQESRKTASLIVEGKCKADIRKLVWPENIYQVKAEYRAIEVNWKQGAGIKKGDTIFMYVGAPVSAVLYKCRVTETDIPYQYENGKLTIKAVMKIKLQKRYPPERFTFERLKEEYGIYAVRGPRGIPNSLSEALKK